MKKKAIKNSPGYYITDTGAVYNENGKRLKTWYSKDGYERIRLFSKQHNKRVNRTIHLLVACEFLRIGKYYKDDNTQVNHKDGNKKNNNVSNLEKMTGTENVNHAHDNKLYTYDLHFKVRDIKKHTTMSFRSMREFCRFVKKSLNYVKNRIRISTVYPLLGRYNIHIDVNHYINHISKINKGKTIYVYDHYLDKLYVTNSYSQLGVLFGVSYITVGKYLNKYPKKSYYSAGFTFSLNKTFSKKNIDKKKALHDRHIVWHKLATGNNVRPKRVDIKSLNGNGDPSTCLLGEDIVSSTHSVPL